MDGFVFSQSDIKSLPLLGVQFLGIIKPFQGEFFRQDHCSSHYGTRQGTTPRLIDPRHGTNTPGVQLPLMEERGAKRRAPGGISSGARSL